MTWVTQGCARGSTLGYSPAPLRGWNPVPRSHAGPALSPSPESFHIHVMHPHFNSCSNDLRTVFLQAVRSSGFFYHSIVVNKAKLCCVKCIVPEDFFVLGLRAWRDTPCPDLSLIDKIVGHDPRVPFNASSMARMAVIAVLA
jgi:hypothetical protein